MTKLISVLLIILAIKCIPGLRKKSLDPDDKGESDVHEIEEESSSQVTITISPSVLEESSLPEDKLLPEPRIQIYDSEDRAQPTYFLQSVPESSGASTEEKMKNFDEEKNAHTQQDETDTVKDQTSTEKNQAREKALLASLVDESKKASPNEDESDEGSSPNNSPYGNDSEDQNQSKLDANQENTDPGDNTVDKRTKEEMMKNIYNEMMKNMYNEMMKKVNERSLLSGSSSFPSFLLTKEEKEWQEFEKMMLMMKTGTIPSSPSSSNPINRMPSSSNNPMMNMMIMQMMRNQMTNGQSTGGQSFNPMMMNSMGNGMNPIMGTGGNLMGMEGNLMGTGGNLMGMNPMTRGRFHESGMGATPFQMQRSPYQQMVRMVPIQVPGGQEMVGSGQSLTGQSGQMAPGQEQLVGREISAGQGMYPPGEPATQEQAPEEGNLTVGASEGASEGASVGASGSGSSSPMEGSDGDVSLERRMARMKQQETESGASEVAGQFVQPMESSQIIPKGSSNDKISLAGQSGQYAGQSGQYAGRSAGQQQENDYESQLYAEKEREVSSLVETTPVPSLEESDLLEQLLNANGEGDGHGHGIRRRAKRYRRPKFLVKASIKKLSPDRLEKANWLKEPSPEFCHESILIHDECEAAQRYRERRLGLRGRKGERRWSFSLEDGTCLLYNDPCPQLKRNSFTQLSQCIATCWRQFDNGPEAYY